MSQFAKCRELDLANLLSGEREPLRNLLVGAFPSSPYGEPPANNRSSWAASVFKTASIPLVSLNSDIEISPLVRLVPSNAD